MTIKEEKIGNPRSISGQTSYEAKHIGKVDLALQMIQKAFDSGILAKQKMGINGYFEVEIKSVVLSPCEHL